MRLATFRGPDGQPHVGAVTGDAGNESIVDVSGGRTGDLLMLLLAGRAALDSTRVAADAGAVLRPDRQHEQGKYAFLCVISNTSGVECGLAISHAK